MKALGRAIDKVRDVLRQEAGQDPEQLRESTAGAERDYAELLRTYGTGALRAQLGVVGGKGGRPAGAGQAIDALRALGVSRDVARGLLDAAGLAGSK